MKNIPPLKQLSGNISEYLYFEEFVNNGIQGFVMVVLQNWELFSFLAAKQALHIEISGGDSLTQRPLAPSEVLGNTEGHEMKEHTGILRQI